MGQHGVQGLVGEVDPGRLTPGGLTALDIVQARRAEMSRWSESSRARYADLIAGLDAVARLLK